MLSETEFADFVRVRGPALLRTACFLAGGRHDGEDLFQQTLVSAYASFRRIRDPQAMESYVRTTMVRQSISTSRRGWRKRELTTDELPERPATSATSPIDDRAELWPLLRELSPKQRAVMFLRYYDDLSEAQIAAELGCSQGAVKSHSSRAMERLRDLIAEPPADKETSHDATR